MSEYSEPFSTPQQQRPTPYIHCGEPGKSRKENFDFFKILPHRNVSTCAAKTYTRKLFLRFFGFSSRTAPIVRNSRFRSLRRVRDSNGVTVLSGRKGQEALVFGPARTLQTSRSSYGRTLRCKAQNSLRPAPALPDGLANAISRRAPLRPPKSPLKTSGTWSERVNELHVSQKG